MRPVDKRRFSNRRPASWGACANKRQGAFSRSFMAIHWNISRF